MEDDFVSKDYTEYAKYYSEESFWEKLSEVDVLAGKEVIEKALILYYCLELKKDLNSEMKNKIASVLGYFIYPVDDIPDWIPGIGFSDDLEAILGLLQSLSGRISEQIIIKAQSKSTEFFQK